MNRMTENILIALGGFIIGGILGGVITNEKLKKVYAKRANDDIRDVKKHYMKLYKGGEYSTPEKAVETYKDRLIDLGYTEDEAAFPKGDEAEELLTTEVADEDCDGTEAVPYEELKSHSKYKPGFRPGYSEEVKAEEAQRLRDVMDAEEIASRDLTRPFVISNEEFMEDPDENQTDKISLTYFSEDDTLIDELEDVIPDIIGTIGLECLSKFGYKSGDASIVMVRNLEKGIDFEVVLDERAYSDVVLGIRRPKDRPTKFREDD